MREQKVMKQYFKLSNAEKCEKEMKWKYLKSVLAMLFHMEIDYFIKIHDPTVLERNTILQHLRRDKNPAIWVTFFQLKIA